MDPRIQELHLSFMWGEAFPNLLDGSTPHAPMGFLGNPISFQNRYNQMKAWVKQQNSTSRDKQSEIEARCGGDTKRLTAELMQLDEQMRCVFDDPLLLTPPWPWFDEPADQHFWCYYLEGWEPNEITGDEAWKFLVPLRANLRIKPPVPWGTTGPSWRTIIDGWYYPHGIALMITTHLSFDRENGAPSEGVRPARMMEVALQVRNAQIFQVTLPDGRQGKLKVDALANELMKHMRERALGAGGGTGHRQSQPLTVSTVVKGTGIQLGILPPPNSDLHQMLDGLCSWDDSWNTATNLPSLMDRNLLLAASHGGDVVYNNKSGRAVWMPQLFTPSNRRKHKLSCYHRNLAFAMLQTEMLAKSITLYTDLTSPGVNAPNVLRELAHCAAKRLSLLYAAQKEKGAKLTYHSASPRAYVDDNGLKDAINTFCQDEKLPGLTWTKH